MNKEKFRALLIKTIKAAGQELIDKAEDLVKDCDLIKDFNIWVQFPIKGYKFDGVPTIKISESHYIKRCIDIFEEVWQDE